MSDPAARAIWISRDTLAVPSDLLVSGQLPAFVGHADIDLCPSEFSSDDIAADPRVKEGYRAFRLGEGGALTTERVLSILRGPVLVENLTEAVGVQIGGVLDDVYGKPASETKLGITWTGGAPSLRVWAPTASDVHLLLWKEETGDPLRLHATRDAETGVWSVVGTASWSDLEYLWDVRVYVPQLGRVAQFQVTDPYSAGLTVDSKRSVLTDLGDPRWKPEGWGDSLPPALRTQAAQTLYELHVRDFSIFDPSVPEGLRGTYGAFTLPDSIGRRHLGELADAGITSVHLLPTFDIASSSIPEDRARQKIPEIAGTELLPGNDAVLAKIAGFGPASELQQKAVQEVKDLDGFNWGYEPLHWGVPEGSYASAENQIGGRRTLEYREMVAALHRMGLRVILDVVYNHTAASGSCDQSVLDRIVPGYYHRLSGAGHVETSTCCANVATERLMAEKLMVDTLVRWVRHYHVDGFRFDLMGHHSLENMQAVRTSLDQLTEERDGVDGSRVYLYGEGWNFGEVAGDRLFTQARQGNLMGTGIGAFNDRLRDAVRGGTPFDPDQRRCQGFASGQFTDPNVHAAAGTAAREAHHGLQWNQGLVMLGLVGALADYPVPTLNGQILGRDLDGAGFAQQPAECVNYVEAHDNETLYDNNVFKLPESAGMETRVRMHLLANSVVALGQGVAFFAAGTELLRSKSLDRDSYNSGDWFNGIDWTGQRTTFGTGLPAAGPNREKWPVMQPLLQNLELRPDAAAMTQAREGFLDFLRIRSSSPLFSLGGADAIRQKVSFPSWVTPPGVIAMLISDEPDPVDEDCQAILVIFNASPRAWEGEIEALVGRRFVLHPVQAEGSDSVVRESIWDAELGRLTVPARTTTVYVEPRQSQA